MLPLPGSQALAMIACPASFQTLYFIPYTSSTLERAPHRKLWCRAKNLYSGMERPLSRETAKRVLKIEADAIEELIGRIGSEFDRAEDLVASATGRVIVSGLGKSGIVARKIAATLSSVGVPAFYLHPVEGAHGDLGMVMRGDVAIVISKSGATDELSDIMSHLKHLGIPVIAMTGNLSSPLANVADVVLDISVACEACLINTIPTASTTVTLALGDALAISLFEAKGLTAEDYAVLHPGGSIGKKLTYRVEDLMVSGDDLPLTDIGSPMSRVIEVMSEKKLGFAIVTEKGEIAGVITDGDLRRLLQRVERPLDIDARSALEKSTREGQVRKMPITITRSAYAARAANLMETNIITTLVVTREDGSPEGIVRWIDLSLAGVV